MTDSVNSQNKKIEEEDLLIQDFKESGKIMQNLATYVLVRLGKCHLCFPFTLVEAILSSRSLCLELKRRNHCYRRL